MRLPKRAFRPQPIDPQPSKSAPVKVEISLNVKFPDVQTTHIEIGGQFAYDIYIRQNSLNAHAHGGDFSVTAKSVDGDPVMEVLDLKTDARLAIFRDHFVDVGSPFNEKPAAGQERPLPAGFLGMDKGVYNAKGQICGQKNDGVILRQNLYSADHCVTRYRVQNLIGLHIAYGSERFVFAAMNADGKLTLMSADQYGAISNSSFNTLIYSGRYFQAQVTLQAQRNFIVKFNAVNENYPVEENESWQAEIKRAVTQWLDTKEKIEPQLRKLMASSRATPPSELDYAL